MSTNAEDPPMIPLTAKAVGKAAVSGLQGSLRSNVEIMKAYKRAYMRVWKAQNADKYRELNRLYNARARDRQREKLETLQRELAEAKAQLDALAQQMALAVPQGADL